METMVNMNSLSLFKGKKVLITGDTGFKGSWLGFWLHELGANVLGYALPPERDNDHYNVIGLNSLIKHIDGDILDFEFFQSVFNSFQPEFVFHLAAQPLVRLSYEKPKLTFETNVLGSVNVLELARSSDSLRSLIYVTSDKCYRNKDWVWGYRENDELGGHDPYSASKAAAEIVFSAYMNSYFNQMNQLGIASVRAGNVIGGGDWAIDRIIPDCIRSLQTGQPICLRNPMSTRPWQHVLEPLFGYLSLAVKLYNNPKRYSDSWNFGPRIESVKTVDELATRIVSLWGSGEVKTCIQSHSPKEANLLQLNCDKASQMLEWSPRWDFERTLIETVNWYKGSFDGKNPLELTRQQLNSYMEGSR